MSLCKEFYLPFTFQFHTELVYIIIFIWCIIRQSCTNTDWTNTLLHFCLVSTNRVSLTSIPGRKFICPCQFIQSLRINQQYLCITNGGIWLKHNTRYIIWRVMSITNVIWVYILLNSNTST